MPSRSIFHASTVKEIRKAMRAQNGRRGAFSTPMKLTRGNYAHVLYCTVNAPARPGGRARTRASALLWKSHDCAGSYFRNHRPADHFVGRLRSDHPATAGDAALAAEPAFLFVHLDHLLVGGTADGARQTPRALSEFLRTALAAVPDHRVGHRHDLGLCHGAMVGGTAQDELQRKHLSERHHVYHVGDGSAAHAHG